MEGVSDTMTEFPEIDLFQVGFETGDNLSAKLRKNDQRSCLQSHPEKI